jgi:aspartate ammonia-lyase
MLAARFMDGTTPTQRGDSMSDITTNEAGFREERDSMGVLRVPTSALYGAQTQRAIENFPVSGMHAHPEMIRATVLVKKAAALANMSTGRLDPRKGQAIVQAADEILGGQWHDQFVVDVYQAGAGTSHNMNANEVLANRAIDLLGGQRGDRDLVDPNDDVNMAQSTNDVFPTAMRIATLTMLTRTLVPALEELRDALAGKGREFDTIVKSGRTHLQDAVPIRLGQEFSAYALIIDRDIKRARDASAILHELNIGATAVGTGLNAEPDYIARVVRNLGELTGFDFHPATSLVEMTQSMAAFVEISGALRVLAVDLTKIANDLRLLSSGPMTGLAEIRLPAVQPGSSIMPGKVNPVMAEMLNMICYQVMGNDLTIAMGAQAGQLELNVMMPVIIHNMLQSLTILSNGVRTFTQRCIRGIEADAARCEMLAFRSAGLATALAPYIGYNEAAEIAKLTIKSGRDIREIVREQHVLPEEDLTAILQPRAMTEPGIAGQGVVKTPLKGHGA